MQLWGRFKQNKQLQKQKAVPRNNNMYSFLLLLFVFAIAIVFECTLKLCKYLVFF